MNTLQVVEENKVMNFNGVFGEVRTVEVEGKTKFVGSDVAKCLGYAIPSKAVNTHCKGVSKMEVPTIGGIQEMIVISEGDVYRLISRSKLPQAEQFESWVFDEVLPQIRSTGGYIPISKDDDEQQIMAKALLIANNTLSKKDKIIHAQKEVIAAAQPKILFADSVSASHTTILIRELAKLLKQNGLDTGERRLFEKLRHDGFLIKSGSDRNMPTQRSMDLGLFEIKETAVIRSDGNTTINKTPKVTGKGQVYFIKKYLG